MRENTIKLLTALDEGILDSKQVVEIPPDNPEVRHMVKTYQRLQKYADEML